MDLKVLRENFKVYMQNRYPNDNNISSTISMAFFLERYGDEFGMDFQNVLSERIVPESYRQKLEESFISSKNPRARAIIYERSLRLLLEYLEGKPILDTSRISKQSTKRSARNVASNISIPRPTKEAVDMYLQKWTQLPAYTDQEEALYILFRETYPTNNKLNEVLIKCSCLNDFYGTNIFNIFPMAKHIMSLTIYSRLTDGDPTLVNDIARGHGITSKSGKELNLFSFATKYCSHHNPLEYPIFDSYVEKLLIHYRNLDRFSEFTSEELRDFVVFKRVIEDFRKVYHLEDYNLKQIDQYLWQFGKDVFPKQY